MEVINQEGEDSFLAGCPKQLGEGECPPPTGLVAGRGVRGSAVDVGERGIQSDQCRRDFRCDASCPWERGQRPGELACQSEWQVAIPRVSTHVSNSASGMTDA